LGQPKHDPSLWQIAWDGGQVVGQVMALVERGRGELFEVSVRPAWRRRGLGRGLLVRAIHDLRVRGVAVIRLHTNAFFRTRARDLYEGVGFRVVKEFPRYRKPFDK
jgi:ribosomal protein S18 acetylase RimI-like enzyme